MKESLSSGHNIDHISDLVEKIESHIDHVAHTINQQDMQPAFELKTYTLSAESLEYAILPDTVRCLVEKGHALSDVRVTFEQDHSKFSHVAVGCQFEFDHEDGTHLEIVAPVSPHTPTLDAIITHQNGERSNRLIHTVDKEEIATFLVSVIDRGGLVAQHFNNPGRFSEFLENPFSQESVEQLLSPHTFSQQTQTRYELDAPTHAPVTIETVHLDDDLDYVILDLWHTDDRTNVSTLTYLNPDMPAAEPYLVPSTSYISDILGLEVDNVPTDPTAQQLAEILDRIDMIRQAHFVDTTTESIDQHPELS